VEYLPASVDGETVTVAADGVIEYVPAAVGAVVDAA
jgi:hypothetical protein